MGNYLSEPHLDFENTADYGTCPEGRVQWAAVNVQGWRKTQQDYLFHEFGIETSAYIAPSKGHRLGAESDPESEEAEDQYQRKEGAQAAKEGEDNGMPSTTPRSMLKKSTNSQGSKVKKTVRIVTSDNEAEEEEDPQGPQAAQSPAKLREGGKK